MTTPVEPELRHVWVESHGGYGPPRAGIVVAWQHAPVRNATASAWNALVIVAAYPGAVLIEWVGGDRIRPVRDPSPREDARRA